MPKFAGVDPSLTSSGMATFDTESGERSVASFSSSPDKGSIESKLARVEGLAAKIVDAVCLGEAPHAVAIEGPAFSSNTGKVWDRAGLWWLVVKGFSDRGVLVVEVPPTSRAKYATGNGRAGKDEVLLAVARNYSDFDIKNNDQADAVILCAMIARVHGVPFDGDVAKNRLEAVIKLQKELKWEV